MGIKELVKRIIVRLYESDKVGKFNAKARRIIALQERISAWEKPSGSDIRKHREYWSSLKNRINTDWLYIYGNISGVFDPHFVPESLYYTRVEPCLNNKAFAKCYNDKNCYSIFIDCEGLPGVFISDIEGVFYDATRNAVSAERAKEILNKQARFIIKPAVDSGGGKDVTLWSKDDDSYVSNNNERLDLSAIFKRYGKNFIIQEVIDQHPFYSRYNPASVNTVRIVTYRSVNDNKIHILHIIFRVGWEGKITDNQASGGFACGVTSEGLLTGAAVDKNGNRYTSVNGVPLEKGLRLEGIDMMIRMAEQTAAKYYYSRLLGMDICLDSNGRVRIIEVNNVNIEINFVQMLNGSLFGEYTGEVRDYCRDSERSFMIDFDI